MFQRSHFQLIKKRLGEKRRFIQVILGPRQVGKSTLMRQVLSEIRIPFHDASADAVPASDRIWLSQQWEMARMKMQQIQSTEYLLVVDEIQKINNWSEIVKKLWDQDTHDNLNIKVILLGSSRLLLQQGLTESLAGRFENIYMGHWSFKEMAEAFGWNENQYVWYGGYPGSAELIAEEARWKNYVADSLIETSISKDILLLTRVDKPALMKRLFEFGCHYSGQILSFTKIMGQLQDAGNTTTLSHYLELLDTAGLLAGLEKYAKEKVRKRSSSPKFQVHNTALISAQRSENISEIISQPALWGRMVESAVGAHLINLSYTQNYSVRYWRNGNDEIDFVLEKKDNAIGLEIKSGTNLKNTGANAFVKQFGAVKVYLVGSEGMPWKEFLRLDPESLF